MTTPPEPVVGERRHLLNLAYRLLGSLAEAEDAVQETYARWYALTPAQRAAISSPGAWLTTVADRICLDVLGSARARREQYVGEWLPEPVPDQPDSVADRITLDESVTMAFLVTLEAMTPAQRVALVLHDVFGYAFAEVAEITGRTPAACRELASSARRRVRAARPAAPATGHADVIRDFKQAWEAGDIEALIGLLDPGATLTADGGGVVRAALHPIEGGAEVARYVAALTAGPLTLVERTVNGLPGLLLTRDGDLAAVYAFDVADGRITRIWAMRNPEKLRPWLG
ncbi:RNA polymerase sigma-70 factor (ECF subfamily) [Amycolatopsis lexingtonensis]|uniref:RNA polymerase sigma-70 factor (ECF subfamily) n=1 Tax=Amycolatopsis lexingtonensis TaxID=218822 RepID=A0ABR9IC99_9PSEU|nr:RNA polymerase sigma factor SigJ [Amycolatopsis lexingtonensis]MBE1500808.1 RNA polymerase sigma-70 factor (ECF subfamily) [Amycolatopsis lexingtonensis]